MKILILGGEGFIGTHLVKRLYKKHHIVSYGNNRRNSLKFFPDLVDKIEIVHGDILDFQKLDFNMRECNIVINLCAIAGVSNYFKKPADVAIVNGVGTFNALECAKKNDIKKVLILSSSEVYGDSNDPDEINGSSLFTSVHNSRLTYSISKLYGDTLALAYHKQFGLDVCILRPYGIFGAAQLGEGFVQIACRKAVKNEDIPVVGDGLQWRDWCYVNDFVCSVESCIDSDKVSGQIMNIGNPNNYMTILELAQKIITLSESKSKIAFIERKSVRDTMHRQSNIELARSFIGFENKTSFDDALLETIEWYRKFNIGEDMSI